MSEIIYDHEVLRRRVEELKAQGKRIVFTNGCFNLLHVGHLRYLEGAKALGDVMIVALNTDESVRGLKGKDYPVVPLAERAELIAALRCVDLVTAFGDRKCEKLLLLLKPHVQAKGPDYTLETIPERDTVLSYGGELAITGDPKDHSTTDLMRKVAAWQGKKASSP